MQDSALQIDIGVHHDIIALFLALAKNETAVALITGVTQDDVADGVQSVMIGAVQGHVLHVKISLVFTLLKHVHENTEVIKVPVGTDELALDLLDPFGVRRREHDLLHVAYS